MLKVKSEIADSIRTEIELEACIKNRIEAYREESDPLVMEMVRGEIDSSLGRVPSLEDIQSRIVNIKQRYPKPREVE